MKLKHIKTILPPQANEAKICAIDWSPNGKKFAACSDDRVIMLFDENGEKKDRFATKSSDTKYGKKNYVVNAIAFSPDSSKLAVGQSDSIVYVYKLGERWDDKKAICNKFFQPSSVTCLIWPIDQPIVLGLLDGKVRVANIKTNKSHTVYNADKFTVSLSSNSTSKGFISGHSDGSIIRYFFDDEGSNDTQGKIATHPSAPYALAWGSSNTIIAAGCDKRIYVYNRDGRILQQFDFSRDLNEKEFTVASSNPSGQSVVIGSYNKLRILNWNIRKGIWEEGEIKEIINLYTISGLCWKKDGSKVCISNICGGINLFDCCLRKVIYKDKFELNYVGPSQVIVNNVKTNVKIIIKSYFGHEINEVKITGKDKYIIAHTSETLMLGDMSTNKLSEIPWQSSGVQEKFIFDSDNVCMIYKGGELTLIEYGLSEILGCVRTEFISPHHISIRINERKQLNLEKNKKLAYLIDLKTVSVLDLCTGVSIQISNDSKIDWIELNEIGTHILFRDKKLRLQLSNIETGSRINLLNYCSYVQWVPGSDVIVAQSRENLCIWYNIKCPDRVTSFPLKGDIHNIVRSEGKTEVLVNEGMHQVAYSLDEGLIEFQTALEDGDFGRAVSFLESIELTEETESMWRNLADKALLTGIEHIDIAERCYAALGDICKTHYLHETIRMYNDNEIQKVKQYKVNARLALLTNNFKLAENIYLENNKIDEAIEMYKSLYMWDEAIEVATIKGHSSEATLRNSYYQWLLNTNQHEKAGESKEMNGDYLDAISLYIKSGVPARAARLALSKRDIISADLINRIAQSLLKFELFEKAGELYELVANKSEAMKCYRKGNSFQRAVELARDSFPSDVLRLEEEWGNYLVSIHQLDNAIQHYIESGSYVKAIDAAISAQQWQKVSTILENQDGNNKDFTKYYRILAEHFLSIKKFEKAEEYFIKGSFYRQAVEAYLNCGMWERAYSIGSRYLDKSEFLKMYEAQSQQLEVDGKFKEAEKLFLTIDRPQEAINMYKRNKMQKDVIRLINKYNPEEIDPTLAKLAEEAEKDGNIKQAEQYYLQIGDWKSAVNLYRKKNMWEDAYRVSQAINDAEASKQVGYLWAKHLGGESAVKLLNRLGLLDKAIDYACEHNAFDFAFELGKSVNDSKVSEIHGKYAMYLEDEGRFQEAEAAFIKANKPREAVLMWVHQQDWDAAQRVAENFDSDSVSDVLVGQARFAFNSRDYKKSESYLIRAQRPELAVKLYKEASMWDDAIRVCKEYLPHKLEDLQEDYDRELALHYSKSDKMTIGKPNDSVNIFQSLQDQGRQWESNKEYLRAVECYLKISLDLVEIPTQYEVQIMEKSWMRAGEICLKHLTNDQAIKVIEIIGPRLIKIKKFILASDFFKAVDKVKEALNALIEGEEWEKAKALARGVNPKYETYVEEKYKIFLKSSGKAAELENLDLIEALNIYAEQNNWDKCLSMAQDTTPHILHKYLAIYATQLIKSNQSLQALQMYLKYGSPYFEQNFNIYKRIFKDILSMRDTNNGKSYLLWGKLRDFMFKINLDTDSTQSDETLISFQKMLQASHYYAIRSAMMASNQNLDELITQISISLLRYTDIIPVDKAFYEAGLLCRNRSYFSMAFIFFNRYLDLVEAIEDPDGSSDLLDNTDFEDTDIPLEVPLPDKRYTNTQEHNEVKEWVLSMSMDQKLEHKLPIDERNIFIGSLYDSYTGKNSMPCVISGFPVLKNEQIFKQNKKCISENFNKFQMATKVSRSTECADVLRFINEWCGSLSPSG